MMHVKLEAYNTLKFVSVVPQNFLDLLGPVKTENDRVDNSLLYEVYSEHVDFLITEDRKLREKALLVGCEDKVFSIDGFITKATNEHPELVEYKVLDVKKELFANVDIGDSFFDSLKENYEGFSRWFHRKCNEEAYVCRSDDGHIQGFLYLKVETEEQDFSGIEPAFDVRKRLKVGTFKVISTGFRLGERFVKIIFDNALAQGVDEIYVTMFDDDPSVNALFRLLTRWGFCKWGLKGKKARKEIVLVKKIGMIDENKSIQENFPNISYSGKKIIMPILPQYHTSLLPDSILNTEYQGDFIDGKAHRYALKKIYISFAWNTNGAKPGDLMLFYRPGEDGYKAYKSVVSSLAVVDEIVFPSSLKELLDVCQNRSVFTREELEYFWRTKQGHISIIKFIFITNLVKRPILKDLRDAGIVGSCEGPRPYTIISDAEYDIIMQLAKTQIQYVR